jgi:hypothetical protein
MAAKEAEITPKQRAIAEARISGKSLEEVAAEFSTTPTKAQAALEQVLSQLVGEDRDTIRTTTEIRIDRVIANANRDLRSASTQGERSALYSLILRAESQRATLLGLNMRNTL